MAHPAAVAGAAVIGFIGNEAVAVFRLRVGRQIHSAALVADGYHARVDGWTSLAAFAVTHAVRLLLVPLRVAVTRRQDSRAAMDRNVARSNEALDTGLRRRPFPGTAASLLPGVLVPAGTGLVPAGERRFTQGSPHAAINSSTFSVECP